ncbi:hypothetical protein HNY73_017957 [Argiope bruennichi]|uniref:Uncharacterized protein n=2 Tax=Argiope bruennichi TaxID=94029 RepID=A0A8T0ECG6_ARGBR|nr:hypothetical protein HNY73_017957 [Argiope bruennichi]
MIPSHVILPEDEIHLTNPTTKEENEELDKEIEHLKQRILKERIHKNILKTKLSEQRHVQEELVIFINKLRDIKAIVSQVKGAQDDLKFTLEKCWEIWNALKQPPQIK